ncbi:MAG: ThuA domain-containing protein [Saprospiraceae bacterium]
MTGQFVAHPGGQIDFRQNVADPSDPITAGIKDFSHQNRAILHAYLTPISKRGDPFTFNSDHDEWINGAVMPVIWKKYFGQGHIFCITLGHDPAEFDQAIPKQLLMNGFRWASGSKYEPKEEWLNPVY